MTEVTPADLLQYGFIPEFIGRVPMIVGLADLTQDELISVLTEPRNALIRQYQTLLKMDNVELEFTREALEETAAEARRRGAGARGLRAIVEDTLMDVMYELPSMDQVRKCIVGGETITDGAPPILLDEDGERVYMRESEAESPAA